MVEASTAFPLRAVVCALSSSGRPIGHQWGRKFGSEPQRGLELRTQHRSSMLLAAQQLVAASHVAQREQSESPREIAEPPSHRTIRKAAIHC